MDTSLIDKFESYLRNVKNRSELTITAYCTDMRQFCAVFKDKQSLGEITRADIEGRYIANLAASGLSPASRARKLASVKSFFKWAKTNGYIVENFVENVENPKIPQAEPKIMSKEEIKSVIKSAKTNGRYFENKFRDLAILSLMFNTGIRRAEVVNAKLADINLEESSMLVHGKGNKERIVYYNDNTRAILSEYIKVHRKLMKESENSEYLFVSREAKKMSICSINRIVNAHLEMAGVKDKGYTAHSTRKAFATAVYEATSDIFATQKLLGHSSPNTTMRYVKASEEMKKKAAKSISF